MIALAIDGVVSFSIAPLRMVTTAGIAMFLLSLAGGVYAIGMRLLTNNWVPGWTLLFFSSLMIGGMQFVFLGIIGEYVGRIYGEAKARPLFFVLEMMGPPAFVDAERQRNEPAPARYV